MFYYGMYMENIKSKVGKKIKQYRVLRGLTQHDLAELIGLTEKQISKIETGVHYPKFENFIKILDVLNIQMKDFDFECPSSSKSDSLKKSLYKAINRASDEKLKCYSSIIKQIDNLLNINK